MTADFAVTWDYRCPFARNAHEHLIVAQEASPDWSVQYLAFSLNQVHVDEGDPDVWDDKVKFPSLLPMLAGIAVRDRWPDRFPAFHLAMFAARHDEGRDIRDRSVVLGVLEDQGLDPDAVLAEIDTGGPMKTFRHEHETAVTEHHVFGVPTFIAGDQAVFVRYMHRPEGDRELAKRTVERTIELLTEWPDLNEFKRTTIAR